MTLTDVQTPYVEAVIRFTDRASEGAVLHSEDHESSTFQLEPHRVRIHDARAANNMSFEENGFTLVRHRLEIDYLDNDEVRRRWYPEAIDIVRRLTGAAEVIAFLDMVRSETREEGMEPANNAHVDFDEASLHQWVRTLRPADADTLLKKRLVNINLWRPIRPVERMPLAVCDASTVSRGDLVRTLIGAKPGEQAGDLAGFNLAYSPDQRWYYYPDMQPDEVMAFRLFDSDRSRPHLGAHTAFEHPGSRPGAAPRLSIEVRTVAFLD